ncbi:MAG: hypothetical protein ACREPB_03410 [Arenimonas sp.]
MDTTAARGMGATNSYRLSGQGKGRGGAICMACGESFPLKSNQGVFEETWRIMSETFPMTSCPSVLCGNHRVPIGTIKAYQSFGHTATGSSRYRCTQCLGTFSVALPGRNPIARQEQSHKNKMILSMLVGKMPLRRICEAADVTPRVLYARIDFFHEQALAFLADREQHLATMRIPRLYIGVDRQDYMINWSRRQDRRNITLSAVASADNASGYVFGMHPNFDPELDPVEIESQALAINDAGSPQQHRRFARVWLQADYDVAKTKPQPSSSRGGLVSRIANRYAETQSRPDIESPEAPSMSERLPEHGMQIHAEYTLYGHFLALHRLLDQVGKVRFFLDQDSGMRAACLGSFVDRIQARTCDAFYVRIAKDLTIDEKRRRMKEAQQAFKAEAATHPELDENELKLRLLKQRIIEARTIGPWKDRWVMHPLPTMAEPEKALCYLTDMGDYDDDHLAWLHNKASLHGVDSWFNRLRRRCSMLERPMSSAGNRGRVWNGYSPYRPEQVAKLLTILRACHNYIWVGEGNRAKERGTPAMRLGLARAPLDYNEIIYYSRTAQPK